MNSLCRIAHVVGWSVVALGIAAGESFGQPPQHPNVPAQAAQFMRDTGFLFSLSRPEDISRIVKMRYIGVLEATLALEKLARKEFHNDHDEPHRAAQLL